MLIARLLVAAQDGVDVYVEESRHLPGGGQPGAGVQGAVGQCPSHGGGDLLRKWEAEPASIRISISVVPTHVPGQQVAEQPGRRGGVVNGHDELLAVVQLSHTTCPDRSASPRLPLAILYPRPPRSGNGRTLSAHALSIR